MWRQTADRNSQRHSASAANAAREAVAAFREALKERTRERAPLKWASSFGGEALHLWSLPSGAAKSQWLRPL